MEIYDPPLSEKVKELYDLLVAAENKRGIAAKDKQREVSMARRSFLKARQKQLEPIARDKSERYDLMAKEESARTGHSVKPGTMMQLLTRKKA